MQAHKSLFFIISGFALAIAIVVGGFYLIYGIPDFLKKKNDILVFGVPYHGVFGGTMVATTPQGVVAMILGYWGDERTTLVDIIKKFPPRRSSAEQKNFYAELVSFFEENDYIVNVVELNEISDFERYLKKDIPVILTLKIDADEPSVLESHILIGIRWNTSTLVFHTPMRGNNYEISFSEFEKLLPDSQTPRLFLVIKPSLTIASLIAGPSKIKKPYPSRLGIMDSQNIRDFQILVGKAAEIEDHQESVALYKDIFQHPGFYEIRPDGRMAVYLELAKRYIQMKEMDKAISIIEKEVVPLNNSFAQKYNEWPAIAGWPKTYTEWFIPHIVLGAAYFEKEDFVQAKKAFLRARELVPFGETISYVEEKLEQVEAVLGSS